MTKEAVKVAYDAAKEFKPEPPRPLRRKVLEPDAYPVDAYRSDVTPRAQARQELWYLLVLVRQERGQPPFVVSAGRGGGEI